ncbi:hypothetical protein NP233_g1233 [Leucocoprinus birnbaumii]|uniref:F-box domain-containing protein n=1 Tax=Leucocoprinus birnbaumii TaxID=56174 RepID=A0AAD5W5U1_9AGAR|nr:hypothetical protein NP233_g1233 [Leucocoprinus birnbaumii]
MLPTGSETIFLQPRLYAQRPGKFLLLPLLPFRKPLKALPTEIWADIFAFAVAGGGREATRWAFSFLTICKSFKDVALPILYSTVTLISIDKLEQFYARLYTADQKWDSIRRIPYSTPGRWVLNLDLSGLALEGSKQALRLDSLLALLFPLTPFVRHLSFNPSFTMSRRVIHSLAQREGAVNIRSLEGLAYFKPPSTLPDEDPFVQLLRRCPNIEELEIIGHGVDPNELELIFETFIIDEEHPHSRDLDSFSPLDLPNLRTLTLLSMHHSPLMLGLLHSPLPSLRKLTLTPYDDIPFPISLSTKFIATHGSNLRSLLLSTPKSWPTRLHPSPVDILHSCPTLRHLSLENPLPQLTLPSEKHPLQILSIPRPSADNWLVVDKLSRQLPRLHVLRASEVRKLKKGLSSRAQEAGVQGEVKEWRRRLFRRGIRVLDADWNEFD